MHLAGVANDATIRLPTAARLDNHIRKSFLCRSIIAIHKDELQRGILFGSAARYQLKRFAVTVIATRQCNFLQEIRKQRISTC